MADIANEIRNFLPGKRKQMSSGWINYNCPSCVHHGEPSPDTELRGGFLPTHDGGFVIRCFRCPEKIGWSPGSNMSNKLKNYLKRLGMPHEQIMKLSFKMWQTKEREKSGQETKIDPLWFPNYKEVDLPEGAKPFDYWLSQPNVNPSFQSILEYMTETRGPNVFSWYDFYWSPSRVKDFHKRIILPCYFEDKIVGWTSRRIDNGKPRYIEEVGSHFLFNNAAMYKEDRKYIILVEGPFDAIAIDGVAVMGSTLDNNQIQWLNSSDKEKIVVPDIDPSSGTLVDTALEQNWHVSFLPKMGDNIKDVSEAAREFGRLWVLKRLMDNKIKDKNKIIVERKLLRI